MKQSEINSILNSFFISKEELDSRFSLNKFANSLSSIIVDEFVQNYLLNNPYLSVYLAHTDGSMLIKKIKAFVTFILTAPVNEEYVERIHNIGFIHYSIKLEPEKVSYGFWAINEVLNKLSLTNELVKENKSLISKLLKFVEHIMNNGYYIQKQKKESAGKLEGVNAQNELYVGLNIHKSNVKKIELALQDNSNLKLLDEVLEDSAECSFGKILKKLEDNKQYEYILGTYLSEVQNLHNQWHVEFVELKKAIKTANKANIKMHEENIKSLTTKISLILDSSLKDLLKDGQFSLRSGMKAMQRMTELFYNKDYKDLKKDTSHDIILKAIKSAILSEFSWAIKEVYIDNDNLEVDDNLIMKNIRYGSENIIIKIELKENQKNSYLAEIITLLLEVMELHFFVQNRELSLISFADKAESANKSKDMFLANMSHELRTPINAITGFSQILMIKKDTPDAVKKYVEKINIAGNNLLDLVNTILDFAKLESGKMQFNPTLSNISNVLTEVRILTSPLAQKKNIKLSMPNIVSLNLYIDNTLFKQVLINLLSNAIKFTHENGEVSLSIVYNEDKHTYIFEVKDNGIGLDEVEITKLFQAFSQIENSYQKEHQGTGLGLMISKSIIQELHNGKIWVESKKGKGSSFFVEMPTPIAESTTYKVEKAPKNSKNILIVEDAPEYQKILIENLKHTHNMTITDTVNRAKELISKNKYDFLILDFFLIDGISSEILQFMESENISIPTIVISAEDEIYISSSLSGSTNLECILNKKDTDMICASIRGEKINEKDV